MRVYSHSACTFHDPGPGHAERPLRLVAVTEALREHFPALDWQEAPRASRGQLLRVHDDALLALVLDTTVDGPMALDPDTVLAPGSAEAALRAAGAGIAAVDAVMHGEVRRAFCAVRPPGHHATATVAMGFCLFNNIAVAAAHACDKHGLSRVAVVDFDVHHGNGTQAIFDTDPRVMYLSSHQMPLYPDTGYANERGVGNIVNAPLPPAGGSDAFRSAWREQLLPALDSFRPQMLFISAGFDGHKRDPLAQLELESDDYAWITRELVAVADRHGNGRIVSMLEGGYDLSALRECSVAHVGALFQGASRRSKLLLHMGLAGTASGRQRLDAEMNKDVGMMALALPACSGYGKLATRFPTPSDGFRVRQSLRLLPLSLCIALALPAHAADGDGEDWGLCPIVDAVPSFDDAPAPMGNMATRAQEPTDIDGGQLERAANEQDIVVQDNVRLNRGDQFLGTDKLSYNEETGKYVADGHVRYQDSGMRVTAARAEGDQTADKHRIEDVQYQLTQRRGNGGAQRIDLDGAKGSLVGSTYSTCAPDQRAWELRAHRIDIDTEQGMGVARNATIRIGKVPVMYVPWFMFPVDERRRTGLLYPQLSLSGRNGFDWKQPVYLNLAPNYDATLYPRYMSDRGSLLGAEFRWLYPNGRGEVYGNWMPHDDLPGNEPERYLNDLRGRPIPGATLPEDNRGQFALTATHNFSRSWYANTNLGWVSDTHYFEDFSSSLYGISNYSIRSDAGLYGRGRYWTAQLIADHYQLADYTLTDASLAFDRLPRAYVHWAQPVVGNWLQAGVDTEAVRFQHTEFLGGSRFDVKPYVVMPMEGASWFIRPKLAWRYTAYQADGNGLQRATEFVRRYGGRVTPELIEQFSDTSQSRSMPITSVDAGLYFDRNTTIRGDGYLNTLEPRIYYLNVPYRDQSGLSIYDTGATTFSWGQLFRDNRYTGADRQADANQLTAALTTRLISEETGQERLAASLGQIFYFDDSLVTLPNEAPIDQGKSAWIADASVSPSDRWTLSGTYMWNPKYRAEDMTSFRARYIFDNNGVVNFGYRYRRNSGFRPGIDPPESQDLLEQADFSFLYPINRTWSVVGRYYYSILDKKQLEAIAGVQWESCCLAARLVGRRYLRNRDGELDTRIMFEFELKGLGSAGQNVERALRRGILGYNRDDLYLVPPSSAERLNNGGGQVESTPDPTL